ncbi:MAG: endopeptidase La [bacterium]
MNEETFDSNYLHVLIDIRGKEKYPLFFKHQLEKLDLIDKVDINLKQVTFNIDDTIAIEYSSSSHLSGVVAKIANIEKTKDTSIRLILYPLQYVLIEKRIDFSGYFKVKAKVVEFKEMDDKSKENALLISIKSEAQKLSKFTPLRIIYEDLMRVMGAKDLSILCDTTLPLIEAPKERLLKIIEISEIEKKATEILKIISEQIYMNELREKINKEVTKDIAENQKKYFLNEQLKIIKKELGFGGSAVDEFEEIKAKILKAKMNEESEKKALAELNKLATMAPLSPEATVIRNYLDWLCSIPWHSKTKDNLDIKLAEKILSRNHFGLDRVKERILEYLAVIKMAKQVKGQILCFSGPPGVGKTSLGQSIAQALGRKFVRLSLGGVRDEAEIRGHRKTYIGSMPGRIIQMMKRGGVMNPVFMLDEVDKLGSDFKGDPSSALLEVLDPEINNAFVDHYLEIDYDLSNVLFICTANVVHTIPPALRDRMEIINLPGYLDFEKFEISKRFLIPRTMKESGLTAKDITIDDSALKDIIKKYTMESGVRSLEKTISKVMRKRAKEIASNEKKSNIRVSSKLLTKYLGSPLIMTEAKDKKSLIGVARGLAWTPYGGATLSMETLLLDGSGKVQLTGQLGEVMKESASASISWLRKYSQKYGIEKNFFTKYDIHIHVPEGSIPKDGPSAGITITMSLFSALINKPLRRDFAMTGEVTLRGIILPIGGLQEKLVAAQSAGINNVIIPAANKAQFVELPARVKKDIKIYFIERIDDAIKILYK